MRPSASWAHVPGAGALGHGAGVLGHGAGAYRAVAMPLQRLNSENEPMVPTSATGAPGRAQPKLLFFVLLAGGCLLTFAFISWLAPQAVFEVELDVGGSPTAAAAAAARPTPPPRLVAAEDPEDASRGTEEGEADEDDGSAANDYDAGGGGAAPPQHKGSDTAEDGATPSAVKVGGGARRNFVKVAMLADAGLNDASLMVLRLVRSEGADMVLHQGDLDYVGKADEFFRRVDDVLGRSFPYFLTMGNYEAKRGKGRDVAWEAYYSRHRERLKRFPDTRCAVVSSRVTACEFRRTVSFVTSAIGINASRLASDLKELRAAQTRLWSGDAARWGGEGAGSSTFRFCSWHLPLTTFQVGFREGVPWMASPQLVAAYESCRAAGAAVLTGHEHYYVRSHAVRRFSANASEIQYSTTTARVHGSVWGRNSTEAEVLTLAPGSSLAVVSGLAGHSVSVPSLTHLRRFPHLSAVHPKSLAAAVDPGGKYFFPEITGPVDVTETTSTKLVYTFPPGTPPARRAYPFGALFCSLPRAADSTEARGACYFKTVSGETTDSFVLERSGRG